MVGIGRSTSLSTDGREKIWSCNCEPSRALSLPQLWSCHSYMSSGFDLISLNCRYVFKWRRYPVNFRRIRSSMEKFRQRFSVQVARVMVCVMLVVSVSSTFGDTSCKLKFHLVSALNRNF